MRLPKHLMVGGAVVIATVATAAVAFGATHTTTGAAPQRTHSAAAPAKVAVASSALGRVLVDGRGRTLYLFEKDKHGRSACNREMRQLLAAADRLRQAARDSRSEGVPARNDEARRRASAGHLQPSPALHVRQGHAEGSDERRGARCLRRRVVRGIGRRCQGRNDRQQQQQQPVAGRRRAAATGTRTAGR